MALSHIHLRVPNPEEAAQWYVDLFEAKILETWESAGVGTSVALEMGGTRFHFLGIPQNHHLPEATGGPQTGVDHFGLRTDDLERIVAHLQANEVEVLEPLRAGRNGSVCLIRGPGNVRIELQEFAREP